MTLRIPFRLAAGAGLWLSAVAVADTPPHHADAVPTANAAVISPADQQLADLVARTLVESGKMRGCNVEIACQGGVVALSGSCSAAQHGEMLNIAQNVAGVRKVVDQMNGAAVAPIQPVAGVQGSLPPPMPMPGPVGGGMIGGGMVGSEMGGPAVDPVPVNLPRGGAPYDLNPPRLPPYAWPTYAPYNNNSRVAYPEEYPAQAFPFIGPFYPFPKVPLGWRSIKLEWEDGSWYYGRLATKRDWWKIRYW